MTGAIIAKFRNNGQTCVCANRINVQDGVYDTFASKLKAAVESLKVGNGMDDGVVLEPLIDEAALEKVEEHVADAVSKVSMFFQVANDMLWAVPFLSQRSLRM